MYLYFTNRKTDDEVIYVESADCTFGTVSKACECHGVKPDSFWSWCSDHKLGDKYDTAQKLSMYLAEVRERQYADIKYKEAGVSYAQVNKWCYKQGLKGLPKLVKLNMYLNR